MFLLEKILLQLVAPLGLCLLLVPLGLLLVRLRRLMRTGWCLVVLPLIWLWLWSTPAASLWLRQGLEQQIPAHAAADYPAAQAIVVLGGSIEGARNGWRDSPHLLSGADRLWFGARLYRAGRAPLVVLSGGKSEWSRVDEPEAAAMQAFMLDMGVPDSALAVEARSRNTLENALYTKQLLDERHIDCILLVTSALHMPRALRLFQAQGLNVTPAPTDIDAIPARSAWQNWLPDADALNLSSKALKEYMGIAFYRLRGTPGA